MVFIIVYINYPDTDDTLNTFFSQRLATAPPTLIIFTGDSPIKFPIHVCSACIHFIMPVRPHIITTASRIIYTSFPEQKNTFTIDIIHMLSTDGSK